MPFSLRNANHTFQRLMNVILQGLPCAFVYLDDILMASRTPKDNLLLLWTVFQCLQDNRMIIWPEKCLFDCDQLPFRGHLVSLGGIAPLPEVCPVRVFPCPDFIQGLQQFLGLFNYYCFIPRASTPSTWHAVGSVMN